MCRGLGVYDSLRKGTGCRESHSTRVKLLGEAAHLLTVVSGHSCTTSFVFSSTRITDSLVIPRSRGTSLFLPFIFSCRIGKHQTAFMSALNTYTDDSFKARIQNHCAIPLVLSLCPWLKGPNGRGGGGGEERGRGAAVNWPSRVRACLTATLLNGVSTGLSHCQHTSMVLPQALCLTRSSALHSLPTENLLQLTSETEPTLGSPPGVQRTTQKLAVCRDGGVENTHILRLQAIVSLLLGQNEEPWESHQGQ